MARPARLQGVEAARGVAAVLVVLSHAGALLGGPRDFGTLPLHGALHFGYAGVDFFFVLSGFIICHVHASDIGRPMQLSRYAWRRFVRIYPLYWVVLLLFLLLLAASPTREGWERDPLSLLTSLLLLPHPAHEPILGVAWTLQHEILFYFMFATLIVHRTLGRCVLATWFGLIALQAATGWLDAYPLGFVGSLYNAQFFIGMLVATLLRRHHPRWPGAFLGIGAALFLGVGLFDDWGPGISVHSAPLRAAYALGAGLALYGLAGVELAGRKGRTLSIPAWLRQTGAASYSIYLVHVILLLLIQQALRPLSHGPLWSGSFGELLLDLAFGGTVTLTVGLAILFSLQIEQPLLRRCQAILSARRAARA